MSEEKITAYKAFNADWTCRDFQYKLGETYTHNGDVSLCNSGFHACEAPLDIWNYYPVIGSQFAEVELDGVTDQKEIDTKRAGKSITIKAALTIPMLIAAQIEWTFKAADKKSIAEGYSSTAASSGNYSKAASSGDFSTAACDTNGFACVAGFGGMVKGNPGSALSAGYKDASGKLRIAVGYVGEDGIKADTWYCADNGKLVEA